MCDGRMGMSVFECGWSPILVYPLNFFRFLKQFVLNVE